MRWTGSFPDELLVRLNKNRHRHPHPEASQSGVRETAITLPSPNHV
jgi:hypothetical protein